MLSQNHSDKLELTPSQQRALDQLLRSRENIFLTGGPGTGKSFLIREYLKSQEDKIPVIASTGAAAILMWGRTFHSFFGLGIMQGGHEAVLQRALKNRRLKKRLKAASTVVIDEISMLSSQTLECAEAIARTLRKSVAPWGGLRVIAVGDFAQLPPIGNGSGRDWCFLGNAWSRSRFMTATLHEVKRTEDQEFLAVLEEIRWGRVTAKVEAFLNGRLAAAGNVEKNVLHLFPRRAETEQHNRARLAEISGPLQTFPTQYGGEDPYRERIMKDAPIPAVLELRKGALVMLRVNDPKNRFVNGSMGTVLEMEDDQLMVKVRGKEVEVNPFTFTLLDADGVEVASATNFPVNLAYASTIHKVQGATLDRVHASLRGLWEPGQAYVALSRARSGQAVTLRDWDWSSIKSDPAVLAFYKNESQGV